MTHDGCHEIVIPMARWHVAANDAHANPPARPVYGPWRPAVVQSDTDAA